MRADSFLLHLQELLRAHPAGLSEYELIKQLESARIAGFDKDCLKDNFSLFQTHFLLFNALYQLADHLAAAGNEHVIIHTLRIQLLPAAETSHQALSEADALRAYYLDMNNLESADESSVDELLQQFWTRYLRQDERREALAVLDLEDPVEWTEIKQRHRQLAMTHHPDRGGDEQQLQLINVAMTMLARERQRS